MDFYNGQFDCVIDKGTLDSLSVIFSKIFNINRQENIHK